jgi:hypothetical protein
MHREQLEGSVTPPAKQSSVEPYPVSDAMSKPSSSNSNIDPALGGSASPDQAERDRAEEVWIENIRVIEALRALVHEKLKNHDYVDGEQEGRSPERREDDHMEDVKQEGEGQSLYPVLRAAIDASE